MGKRFLCLILAILIAFSAVGCSKEDLGNARLFDAGQTSDADTFEDLTDDWFCRQMEADPMSCHFTLENPDAYHITFSDQTLCTLTMEEHIKEMDEIKNLLDRLKDIDRNNLTARQRHRSVRSRYPFLLRGTGNIQYPRYRERKKRTKICLTV